MTKGETGTCGFVSQGKRAKLLSTMEPLVRKSHIILMRVLVGSGLGGNLKMTVTRVQWGSTIVVLSALQVSSSDSTIISS